jgi:hypothetical protein
MTIKEVTALRKEFNALKYDYYDLDPALRDMRRLEFVQKIETIRARVWTQMDAITAANSDVPERQRTFYTRTLVTTEADITAFAQIVAPDQALKPRPVPVAAPVPPSAQPADAAPPPSPAKAPDTPRRSSGFFARLLGSGSREPSPAPRQEPYVLKGRPKGLHRPSGKAAEYQYQPKKGQKAAAYQPKKGQKVSFPPGSNACYRNSTGKFFSVVDPLVVPLRDAQDKAVHAPLLDFVDKDRAGELAKNEHLHLHETWIRGLARKKEEEPFTYGRQCDAHELLTTAYRSGNVPLVPKPGSAVYTLTRTVDGQVVERTHDVMMPLGLVADQQKNIHIEPCIEYFLKGNPRSQSQFETPPEHFAFQVKRYTEQHRGAIKINSKRRSITEFKFTEGRSKELFTTVHQCMRGEESNRQLEAHFVPYRGKKNYTDKNNFRCIVKSVNIEPPFHLELICEKEKGKKLEKNAREITKAEYDRIFAKHKHDPDCEKAYSMELAPTEEPKLGKSKDRCHFGPNMNLSFSLKPDLSANNEGAHYAVKAVVCHKGDSMTSGHYVLIAKDAQGLWWLINDDEVSALSQEEAQLAAEHLGYMFYSEKIDRPLPPNNDPRKYTTPEKIQAYVDNFGNDQDMQASLALARQLQAGDNRHAEDEAATQALLAKETAEAKQKAKRLAKDEALAAKMAAALARGEELKERDAGDSDSSN